MSQRINITYSIKFEELETEIRRLLTIALDKMEDTYADHSYLSESSELLDLETFRYIDYDIMDKGHETKNMELFQ